MTLSSPPAITSEFAAIADASPAYGYVLPPFFRANDQAQVRRDIQEFLNGTVLLNLSTISPRGWPVTHCMHFVSVLGTNGSLIIYMFTQPKTRKLLNIAANPRISMTLFRPNELSPPDKTPYLRTYALASALADGEERELAFSTMREKPGYGFAKHLRLEDQPLLRADVLVAIWENRAQGEEPGAIDFTKDIGGAA